MDENNFLMFFMFCVLSQKQTAELQGFDIPVNLFFVCVNAFRLCGRGLAL